MDIDPVVKLKATEIVGQVLTNMVKQPGISAQTATEMKPDVISEISKVILNQTNNEPWYQSTVTLGALITLVTGSYAFGYDVVQHGLPTPTDFATQIGPLFGAGIVLYGRWIQRKPIGS
jgi:hypothetical protein